MENEINLKVRDIQLSMADALLDFCKNNNLTIWAGYGTLLGAVRHKGFIPWDDDVDFMMLRNDFNRLRKIANSSSLPSPLVFDCSRVDVIKVKNCNTTQIAIPKITRNVNYGIWIDIWCLDSMPANNVSDKIYNSIRNKIRFLSNSEQMCYSCSRGISNILFHTFSLCYTCLLGKQHIINSIESKIKQLNGDKLVNFLVFSRMKKNTKYSLLKKYDKKWLSNTVLLPFEDRYYPCPANYHEILKAQYGDYMIPVRGAASHSTTILYVDRPYEEVVNELLYQIPWYKRIFRMI